MIIGACRACVKACVSTGVADCSVPVSVVAGVAAGVGNCGVGHVTAGVADNGVDRGVGLAVGKVRSFFLFVRPCLPWWYWCHQGGSYRRQCLVSSRCAEVYINVDGNCDVNGLSRECRRQILLFVAVQRCEFNLLQNVPIKVYRCCCCISLWVVWMRSKWLVVFDGGWIAAL